MTKLYEALAEAFLAEGVDTQFALMGDGNMHWSTTFARLPGVQTIHVRHEHCAVAAATAYNVATGNIAAASVTCGPGVTQLVTALPAAVRARLPMVVFAGEPPINAKFYNQYIDQVPLVTATGAHYIAAHSVPRMMDYVREAFHIAKYERRPVVLGIPYDLQKLDSTSNQPYETSAVYYPKVGRIHPDPAIVAEVVDRLIAAKRPIIIGGRGVLYAGAKAAVVKLADRCGALLANTLPTRGLFHDHEFSVGIPGSYFTTLGREVFETAEVVLAIGTSLSYYVGGGHYSPRPAGSRWTMRRAVFATGRRPPISMSRRMRWSPRRRSSRASTRSSGPASRRRLRSAPRSWRAGSRLSPLTPRPSTSSPVCSIRARRYAPSTAQSRRIGTSSAAPATRPLGSRNCAAGRPSGSRRSASLVRVGNGLSYALGVAAARRQGRDGKLVLIEGDGGLLFHIQELECVAMACAC